MLNHKPLDNSVFVFKISIMSNEIIIPSEENLMDLGLDERAARLQELGCNFQKSYQAFQPTSNGDERFRHVLHPTATPEQVVYCKFDLLTLEGNRSPNPDGELIYMEVVNLQKLAILSQALHRPEEIRQILA